MMPVRSILQQHKVLLYAFIVLFATSCSLSVPKSSIYAYTPDEGRTNSIVMESPEIICEAEGTGNEHTALAFDITIANKGTDPLSFDPREWSLQYSDQITHVDQMKFVRSMAPAEVSAMYHELSLKAKANRDAGIAIGVILIVGLFVLILAAEEAVDDCDNDCYDCDDNYIDFVPAVTVAAVHQASPNVSMRSEPSDFRTKSDYFNYKSMVVAKESFSSTLIDPGASETFRLFFPREEGMFYLKLLPPDNLGVMMDEDSWFVHRLLSY